MEQPTVLHGDCIEVMQDLPEEFVSAIVTDPPYGLSFMGKEWDHGVPGVPFWAEALRVLKPGGYALVFGGTRTFHRLAVALEDAGFEIRDCMSWMYGTGFPKSHDVSKAIDRAAGAEREVVGPGRWNSVKGSNETQADCLIRPGGKHDETAPATDEAQHWQGYGTALKPAWEPIIVARKPFKGTVAANCLEHGTGALNIDGCRIGTEGGTQKANVQKGSVNGDRAGQVLGANVSFKCDVAQLDKGRWPANVVLDEEAAAMLDEQHSGAARFFYVAKASKSERTVGGAVDNPHPTVKPLALMQWLVRMVSGPDPANDGTLVLDPFAGSGTTGVAAQAEGVSSVLIEREAEYVEIIEQRLAAAEEAAEQ